MPKIIVMLFEFVLRGEMEFFSGTQCIMLLYCTTVVSEAIRQDMLSKKA